MIFLAASPLSPIHDLREFCATLEAKLQERLGPRQKAHIQKFALTGAALEARTSRCLARLLALHYAPKNAILDVDEKNIPFLYGYPDFKLAFSYSGQAAWCAIGFSSDNSTTSSLALDAEYMADAPPSVGIAYYFKKLGFDTTSLSPKSNKNFMLRLWTIYEAAIKLDFPNLPLSFPAFALKRRCGCGGLTTLSFYWQSLYLKKHFICLSSHKIIPQPVSLLWINPCKLITDE